MILPTKHLGLNKSLLGVGADVLRILDQPMSVSRLWDELKQVRSRSESLRISFDWFILTLDLLFVVGAVEYQRGRVTRGRVS